jgi:hypothetical protein
MSNRFYEAARGVGGFVCAFPIFTFASVEGVRSAIGQAVDGRVWDAVGTLTVCVLGGLYIQGSAQEEAERRERAREGKRLDRQIEGLGQHYDIR